MHIILLLFELFYFLIIITPISFQCYYMHYCFSNTLSSFPLHELDATVPNIRPTVYLYQSLPREPSRIVRGQPEQMIAWPKHCVMSRFTWNLSPMRSVHMEPFSLLLRALESREIYYMSRDHPNAHELTNHIRHPSPAPGLRSPGAPEKASLCGIVPVSPTGTKESLPRIFWMGTTYRIGFL